MHGKEKLCTQEIKTTWERCHCLQLYHIFRYHLGQFLVGAVALCALYMMQKLTPNRAIPKEMPWAFSYSFLWADLQFTSLKTWLQFLTERCWDNRWLLFSRAARPLGCSSLFSVPQNSLHTWCGPVLMEKASSRSVCPSSLPDGYSYTELNLCLTDPAVITPELCHHTASLCLLTPLTTDGHPQKGMWGRKMCSVPSIMEDHTGECTKNS